MLDGHITKKKVLTSALLLSTIVPIAMAEEAGKLDALLAMSLEEILQVEVATGTRVQLTEAPAIVSVITAEEIALTGARNLAEALEQIPGMHIMPSINRLTPLFAIRGIFTDSTPQVLVMIDGVETSELTALSVPYSFYYPINAIDRIEVIRGPGSAVYGADALSGVINIITKTADESSDIEVGARTGSFDYYEGWVNANWVDDAFKASLSVTRESQNNDKDRTTQYGVMKRNRDMHNIHLNMSYNGFSMKNWLWRSEQYMGVGAGIIGNDFDVDVMENWHSQISWQGELSEDIEGQFDIALTSAKYDASFQLFPPGTWPVGDDGNLFLPPFTLVNFPDGVIGQPGGSTKRIQYNGAIIYSGIENHRIRVGFGAENAELTDVFETKNFGPGILDVNNIPDDRISQTIVDVSNTPFVYTPDYERDIWFVSLQDEVKISDKIELTAGIRYDKYSDFGSTTNPRVALVYNASETFSTKVMFGTAFRAPKVAELAFVNNPTTLGNPDLEPEKIKTYEVAFSYRPNDVFHGNVNIFSYQSEDLIQLDQTFTYQNIGEQDGSGIEVEFDIRVTESLGISGNASWLDTELPLTDGEKERVPGFMTYLDIRYQISETMVITTQSYFIANRQRQLGDTRPDVDDYIQTDVNLLWRPDDSWSLSAGIKNLFDDSIVEPVPNSALFALGLGFPEDYPMLSRNVFVSGSYRF